MDPYVMLELVDAYNKNPQRYTDEEAEFIATIAQTLGADFERESKPIRKGLFSLLDTVTLGLAPDDLRPMSRGETVYGETSFDKSAGSIGTGIGVLAGGAGLGYGLSKGARGLMGKRKNLFDMVSDPLGTSGISNVGGFII